MRVICVQDFGDRKVGDIIIVPDGSEVAPGWFRPLTDAENAKLDAAEAPPAEEDSGIEPEHDFQQPEDDAGTEETGDEAATTETKKGKG